MMQHVCFRMARKERRFFNSVNVVCIATIAAGCFEYTSYFAEMDDLVLTVRIVTGWMIFNSALCGDALGPN